MKYMLWIAALGAAMLGGCARQQGLESVAQGSADRAAPGNFTNTTPSLQRRLAPLATPLYFEQNVGQTDAQVSFLSRGPGYDVFLTRSGPVFSLQAKPSPPVACASRPCAQRTGRTDIVRMRFADANPDPVAEGLDRQPGKSNYFVGNDPGRWRRNVGHFAKVRYRKVYPGVDVVFYGNQESLEYDFVVAPGADARRIALDMDGAHSMRVDPAGNLVLSTAGGELVQHKPQVYQRIANRRVAVEGRYVLRSARQVGFELGKYDTRSPLVIDPMFAFTNVERTGDTNASVAVDADGNTYVVGITRAPTYPSSPPWQGESDAFLEKFDAAGTMLYEIHLGGGSADFATGVAFDAAGDVLVSGTTSSSDFPLAAAAQPAFGGGDNDSFVAKFSADGSELIYSTYLGGSGNEPSEAPFDTPYWPTWGGNTIAVDADGNAYVTGTTESGDFPTVGGLQAGRGYQADAFVAKFDTAGSVVYSTYLGGRYDDFGHAIAVDTAGHAYVAGGTWSPDFPTAAPLQAQSGWMLAGPDGYWSEDAFVAKLAVDGSTLDYGTYLGGAEDDRAFGLALDAAGNAYIAGQSLSTDFPTLGANQPCYGLSGNMWGDAFVTKLDPNGGAMLYSSCLGGIGSEDFAYAIAVDGAGRAYVTGKTSSLDFPTLNPLQATPESQAESWDQHDAFVSELDADGALSFSTYLSNATLGPDAGYGIAVDGAGSVYVAGLTGTINGGAFLTRIDPVSGLSVSDMTFDEGDDATTQATLKVHLSTPSETPVTFDLVTTAGTALPGVDYEDVSAQGVVIAPGETDGVVNVPIHGDQAVEGDKTFTFDVSKVVGAVLTASHATATIRNDDTVLSVDDIVTMEGNGSGTHEVTIPVRLSAPVDRPVSFNVAVLAGTATGNQDFYPFSGSQTIPAGETSVDFQVVVQGDDAVEPDETFKLVVSEVSGAIVGKSAGTVTIRNDDTRLSIGDVSLIEGNSSTKQAVFTVKLSNPSAQPVTFNVATANKTAGYGTDYAARSLSAQVIAAGTTSKTFAVSVVGDRTVEANETFLVNVSHVAGATVSDSQAIGTIRNDDALLTIADASLAEGNSGTKSLSFTIRLSAASASPVTFNIATANKTAVAGSDYVAKTLKSQVIAAGNTSKVFTVTLDGDRTRETNETFLVNVTGVVGATVKDGQAIGTIVNDD